MTQRCIARVRQRYIAGRVRRSAISATIAISMLAPAITAYARVAKEAKVDIVPKEARTDQDRTRTRVPARRGTSSEVDKTKPKLSELPVRPDILEVERIDDDKVRVRFGGYMGHGGGLRLERIRPGRQTLRSIRARIHDDQGSVRRVFRYGDTNLVPGEEHCYSVSSEFEGQRSPKRTACIRIEGGGTSGNGQETTDDEVPLNERSYLVEVLAIEVLDENGPDFPGSNEVYGAFGATIGPTATKLPSIYTKVLGDLDAGDRRILDTDQRCLGPIQFIREVDENTVVEGFKNERWNCLPYIAPMKIEFKLWESDVNLPEPWTWFPVEFDVSGLDPLEKLDDDDELLGHDIISFSQASLAPQLPWVGSSKTYTKTVNENGRFEVEFQVTRHH